MKNKDQATWYYQLTWQVAEQKSLEASEVREKLIHLMKIWCKSQEATFLETTFTGEFFSIAFTILENINVYKATKGLQKSLIKVVPTATLEIVATKWLNVALNGESRELEGAIAGDSPQDVRVKKVLDALWSAEYYDLDEQVTDDLESFKQYLETRNLAMLEARQQLYLVDMDALQSPINLNCFECTKLYRYGCCCGSPCDMSRKNQKRLDQHLNAITEEMRQLNPRDYDEVMEKGGILSFDGTIKTCNGRCSLLVEHGGVHKCMAHKYALDHAIPIYELCPLSCLMYPLEVMELITDKKKKVILLTSVVDETFAEAYGRWGSYKSLEIEHRCVKVDAHNAIFKKEDYQPVYEVNRKLLTHEFGVEVYLGLQQILSPFVSSYRLNLNIL
ncbi:MAG: hypothetical protein RR090_05395 [Niameybacter sp.]|uniref:hypothetical protein n=1 Tax=Niameybacter sp. TaxID=2033640 RepID=UPI002FCCB461